MKSPKSYSFKIAILLIAIGSMAFLYGYAFHKNFDDDCIPKNADGIAMVDLKNIRNHFVFSCLKKPSECQWNSLESGFKKRLDLSDYGVKTPDYLAFFHIENQALTQWSVALKIEDETVFEKTVSKAHFLKTTLRNGMDSYYSKSMALLVIKHSNQILVSNSSEKQNQIAVKTAEDLFVKKHFLDSEKAQKLIGTANAVTFWLKKNSLLDADGILNLTLEDNEIAVEGQLKPKPKYTKELQFTPNPNALLSLGFDFEMLRGPDILKQHSVQINKMLGFDLDSILVYNPTKTELTLNKIIEKKDSAISYGYDDDFNPIQKVVVNTSREPSFCFSMQTGDSQKVYNYLKAKNAIDNHQVFVNFPLAKTKVAVQNNNFTLEANPVKNGGSQTSVPKIGYLLIHLDKLQPKDWTFVIAKNKFFSLFRSFETLKINLSQENNLVHFQARLKTKERKNLILFVK